MLQINENGIVKLTASKGMTLTNGETYGKEVYLSCNDNAENWHEISEEQHEHIKAEERAKLEAEAQE